MTLIASSACRDVRAYVIRDICNLFTYQKCIQKLSVELYFPDTHQHTRHAYTQHIHIWVPGHQRYY